MYCSVVSADSFLLGCNKDQNFIIQHMHLCLVFNYMR
jgi:hypothetical protein